MMYEFGGKSIRIPEAEIEANMRLGISQEEAIQMWLEDNEYEINEEQAALDAKAKDVKINHGARSEKAIAAAKNKTQKERVKKEDPEKEMVVAKVAVFLSSIPGAENIKIENKTKLITFTIGDNHYKFDLVKSRK